MSDRNQINEGNQPNVDELVSKSQLKRDAKAITDFAVQLATHYLPMLDNLPLSDSAKNALTDYQKHKTNIARRRHAMFMGKCLRAEDLETIQLAIEQLEGTQIREKRAAASIASEEKAAIASKQESIIQELLTEANLMEQMLQQYPVMERQKLRQLVRNIQKLPVDKQDKTKAKLSHYLTECGVQF